MADEPPVEKDGAQCPECFKANTVFFHQQIAEKWRFTLVGGQSEDDRAGLELVELKSDAPVKAGTVKCDACNTSWSVDSYIADRNRV